MKDMNKQIKVQSLLQNRLILYTTLELDPREEEIILYSQMTSQKEEIKTKVNSPGYLVGGSHRPLAELGPLW